MKTHILTNYQRLTQDLDETEQSFKRRCHASLRYGGWRRVGRTKFNRDGDLTVLMLKRTEAHSCG